MERLKKIEEEIKLLQKEKEKEELRIEVDKLKKTTIEETIVIRRTIYQYEPIYPSYPIYTPITTS